VTIRQYFKRRVRWALAVVIGCWLLISSVTQVAGGPFTTIVAVLGTFVFVGADLSVLFDGVQINDSVKDEITIISA
jgi:hypothetical protein